LQIHCSVTAQALAGVALVCVIRFAIAETFMLNARQLKHALVRFAERGCLRIHCNAMQNKRAERVRDNR
jgi:hypothetical protein